VHSTTTVDGSAIDPTSTHHGARSVGDVAGGDQRRHSLWRGALLLAVTIFVCALAPRLATIGNHNTSDEDTWLFRSDAFADSLAGGQPSGMYSRPVFGLDVSTMPGGTTMWIGTLARSVDRTIGDDAGTLQQSSSGHELAQAGVALATSILIAGVALSLRAWSGPIAGWIGGGLLVGEPWVTGLSSVFHTDAIVALGGTLGLVMLALGYGVASEDVPRRPVLVVAAGATAIALAPLTKLTGLVFGIGALTVTGLSLWAHSRKGGGLGLWVRSTMAAVVALGLATTFFYPALIADPGPQLELLERSGSLGESGHLTFFRGKVTETPGLLYYLVALPLRATPWLAICGALALPAGLVLARSRTQCLVLGAAMLPMLAVLSTSSKQLDRYGLSVTVLLIAWVAVTIQALWTDHGRSLSPQHVRLAQAGGAAALGGVVALNLWFAPWGLLYFNPLLGGGDTASSTVLVGWREGLELGSQRILELEDGDCSDTTISYLGIGAFPGVRPSPQRQPVPCDERAPKGESSDYVVAYILARQRNPSGHQNLADNRELVDTVRIHGVDLVEIWR